MCTFCEKVYPGKDLRDIVFARGKYSELRFDPIDKFITIDENGEYDLNVVPDDPYELGFFPNVKFCPYCGRDLAENVEQEPKTGHWEDCSNGWMCSVCERDSRKDTNYCPNCGAEMVEPQESEESDG